MFSDRVYNWQRLGWTLCRKNELIYIRDFEAIQKTHKRKLNRCRNSWLCLELLNLIQYTPAHFLNST